MEAVQLAQILQGYWPVFSGVAVVVFFVLSNIRDHGRRINVLESNKNDQTTLLVQIQKDIVELKTTLSIYFDNKNK